MKKMSHSFTIKNSEQIRNRDFLNLINNIHKNPTANIIISCEKLNVFPSRLRAREGCTFQPLLFSIVLEVLGSTIK